MATNPRYANGSARRKLRRELLMTTTTCDLCGLPMPSLDEVSRMSPTDPRYPVIDEIVPIKYGGNPLSRENTHLVHRACNAKKGAKVPVNPMLWNKAERPYRVSHDWTRPGF